MKYKIGIGLFLYFKVDKYQFIDPIDAFLKTVNCLDFHWI